MRTRRSWRNQERLFNELFKAPAVPVVERDPVAQAEATLASYTAQPFANPRTVNQLRADVNRARIKQARKIALAKGV